MASRSLEFIANFGSKGFLRALSITVALSVAPWLALFGSPPTQPSTAPASAAATPSTIRNAPFSADVETEYDRELPNGNHIHREARGRVYRDQQGRVRTETEIRSFGGASTFEHVAIQDPVLREVIHLDSRSRTANVHHLGEAFPMAASAAGNINSSKPGNVIIAAPQAGQTEATTIPLHAEPNKAPAIELLGSKMLEGILVVGTRTTHVIANGDNGPVVAVTDLWYSHDLQMVILSVSDDGQAGRSVMRVTNIVRAPPNPQLFQVPPDYTVKDGNPMAAVVKR